MIRPKITWEIGRYSKDSDFQIKFLFQNGYYVLLIPMYIPSLVWTFLKKYTDLEFFENVIHTTISSSLKDVNKMSCIEIW